MNFTKRFIAMLLCIIILATGLALVLKAEIGVGPYDAVSQSIFYISGIKVGTVSMILNTLFIIGQWIIKNRQFKLGYFLQFVVILVFGAILNFVLYDVLKFEIKEYVLNVIFFSLGIIIAAFGVAGVMNINIVYTPLEGFLTTIADITNPSFIHYRMAFDVVSIILTFILFFIFDIPLAVREGTIIAALVFSPAMGVFMKLQKSLFHKIGILNQDNDKNNSKQIDIV